MIDWSKVALVFPGQNSQEVGMGADFARTYPVARDLFAEADAILGFPLSKLCFEGPEDELNDTINTQPAIFVTSVAILRALQQVLPEAIPDCVAGHSLGEFAALVAAGSLTFEDAARLVRERGKLMKQAGERNPGGMAAILGLDADHVQEICDVARTQTGGILVVANDNCPGQIVISGDDETLEVALQKAREAGARRAVRLSVSIAAHSPMMGSASVEFEKALNLATFQKAQIPVYANITARPLNTIESIRDELSRQLTHPVRWSESIQNMIANGVQTFIEIGSKDVLSGLIKRIDRSAQRIPLNNVESFQQLVANSR